jgi:hypothetical protein
VQLPRTPYQGVGERLTEDPLGSYHVHFYRTFVDGTAEVPQLKRHRGAVDLEISRSVFRTFDGLVAVVFPGSFRQRFVLLEPGRRPEFLQVNGIL